MVPRWLGKGVTCKWSFVPTAEFFSERSFWLLPHPETLGTSFCLWGLQTVLHGGFQEAPRAPWKVQGGISHKSGG